MKRLDLFDWAVIAFGVAATVVAIYTTTLRHP